MQHDKDETRALAYKLLRIAKDQAVVRYQVLVRYGVIELDADLFSFHTQSGEGIYLTQVTAHSQIRHQVSSESRCVTTYTPTPQEAVEKVVSQWGSPFDDWMHPEPFMGAQGVLRDGQPYTSLKCDADDERWGFINGLLVGQLARHGTELARVEGTTLAELRGLNNLKRRFSSFVAQSECRRSKDLFNYR